MQTFCSAFFFSCLFLAGGFYPSILSSSSCSSSSSLPVFYCCCECCCEARSCSFLTGVSCCLSSSSLALSPALSFLHPLPSTPQSGDIFHLASDPKPSSLSPRVSLLVHAHARARAQPRRAERQTAGGDVSRLSVNSASTGNPTITTQSRPRTIQLIINDLLWYLWSAYLIKWLWNVIKCRNHQTTEVLNRLNES